MSQGVVIRRILRTSRIILPDFRAVSLFRYASKNNSTSKINKKVSDKSKELTHTTVMVQDRLDIQEVPTIVRRVASADVVESSHPENAVHLSITSKEDKSNSGPTQEQILLDSLSKCLDLKELFNIIKPLNNEILSGSVVLHALGRIIEVENNVAYRNMLRSSGNDLNMERLKILDKLLHFIVLNSDSSVLLESLAILSRDTVGTGDASYKWKLINEILIRASDRKFNVNELCEIVNLLSSLKCEHKQKIIDELWSGLIDKGREINENNIGEVFGILPLLKQSQKMIFNMLCRKCDEIWWRLRPSVVVGILRSLQQIQLKVDPLLGLMTRSVNTNINVVSEDEMFQIISGFSACDYTDDNIGGLLEKYSKTRGHKLKNPLLMEGLIDYCVKYRLRYPSVLNACADFLISNYTNISSIHFKSLLMPLGYFQYVPTNRVKFWQIVENFILEKFIQFRPEDIIDVALACIYLEKFPLNLTSKILNPYFLDRMHTSRSGYELQQLRTKLKIFDSAMTLECPQYQGPLLPRDYALKTITADGRLRNVGNYIYDIVVDVVKSCERVSTRVLLPQLPASDLYLIDILLHPAGMDSSLHSINASSDRDLFIAILIHTPEHYCSKEVHLIGPQLMKKRHLKHLGISVVELKYSELVSLKGKTDELQKYLVNKLENLEKSTQ